MSKFRTLRTLSLVGFVAGALLFSGCIVPPNAPPPTARIAYDCIGYSPGGIDITIANETGGTEQQNVAFPYHKEFDRAVGEFVYLSAQAQGTGASFYCQITSNSYLVQSATASGDYVIASVSGSA